MMDMRTDPENYWYLHNSGNNNKSSDLQTHMRERAVNIFIFKLFSTAGKKPLLLVGRQIITCWGRSGTSLVILAFDLGLFELGVLIIFKHFPCTRKLRSDNGKKINVFSCYGLVNYMLNYTNFPFWRSKMINSTRFIDTYLLYIHMNVHVHPLHLTSEL